MATLVFGALGTLVGGPLGGAVGSLIGRELDRQIIGAPAREGARLKELAVSTSSYGTPIARLFGTTRAAGTIVWATKMKETRAKRSGGKGQPGITEYSYSVSLAVLVSSRPIAGIGRIWADGNLLRGAAGDLKTGGRLRVHLGHGDQDRDPLLAAALGAQCPAHRGSAYVVFENLALGDFGNRIPALSFEVFADGAGADLAGALIEPVDGIGHPVAGTAPLTGFAHEGGSIASVLGAIDMLVPLVADTTDAGVLAIGPEPGAPPLALPAPIAWPDGDFGRRSGRQYARSASTTPTLLRYYDDARDYQPGVQRARGRAGSGGERALEIPASCSAAGAAALIDAAGWRMAASGERAAVRIAALDPALMPGRVVALPGAGAFRIESWEWRSGGVELDCVRVPPARSGAYAAADPGTAWRPADRLPAATRLLAFELPWDGAGAADATRVHVALAPAGPGRWAGAALYASRADALVEVAIAGPAAAAIATLAAPLGGSPALMFEPTAALELYCDDPGADFTSVDGAALAAGANRLWLGGEVLQFMIATPLGNGRWRLSGLLRGRGGSEAEARAGHAAGTTAVLLDASLLVLSDAAIDPAHEQLAAIGAGDPQPVLATIGEPGRSRQPLTPVHPRSVAGPDGTLTLGWTRRARGGWAWADAVDTPLVEERERYEIGAGPVANPLGLWTADMPMLALAAADLAAMPPQTPLWVRQIGSHARSPALLLHTLP